MFYVPKFNLSQFMKKVVTTVFSLFFNEIDGIPFNEKLNALIIASICLVTLTLHMLILTK